MENSAAPLFFNTILNSHSTVIAVMVLESTCDFLVAVVSKHEAWTDLVRRSSDRRTM